MSKISVAVLGATGTIGQRFIQMLEDHPYFEIEGLYASERSQGKKLRDVLKVRDHVYLDDTMDRTIEVMDIAKISKSCRIAFSGIPSDLAGPTETELAESGVAVFTNAGSHRMDANVPILIPEVNPDHFESIKDQPTYKDGGFIVTNANCSSTGIALPLVAIDKAFGLKQVFVSTYQALSGAGYPGVPSLDAVGNVVPFISHEEEKMESELAKMLGTYSDDRYPGAVGHDLEPGESEPAVGICPEHLGELALHLLLLVADERDHVPDSVQGRDAWIARSGERLVCGDEDLL